MSEENPTDVLSEDKEIARKAWLRLNAARLDEIEHKKLALDRFLIIIVLVNLIVSLLILLL